MNKVALFWMFTLLLSACINVSQQQNVIVGNFTTHEIYEETDEKKVPCINDDECDYGYYCSAGECIIDGARPCDTDIDCTSRKPYCYNGFCIKSKFPD